MSKKGSKQDSREVYNRKYLETRASQVFYNNPEDNTRRTPESLKLRKDYDAKRMSKPVEFNSVVSWLNELEQLKFKILELEK
jgi:hypothetical protein